MNIRALRAISIIIGFIAFALMIVGATTGRMWLVYTAIGTVVVGSIVILVLMIVRVYKAVNITNNKKEVKDEALLEEEEKYKVNTSHGVENQFASGERMLRQSAKAYKHSTTKEKIFGFLFLFWFLGCIVGALVSSSFGSEILAIVFWALAMGTGVIAAIVVAIKQKISINRAKKYQKEMQSGSPSELDQTTGVVKVCILSSENSIGTGSRSYSTNRITKTIYKVLLDVNGTDKIAYTEKFFNQGDKVRVVFKHGSNLVAILDKVESNQHQQELENINYTIEDSSKIEETNQTEYQNEIEELYKEMENLDDYSEIEDFNFDDDFNEDNNKKKKKGQK